MTTPTTPAASTLWLTDRTRIETGLGRCQRRRYLSNHFGPTGYGIAPKAESLPLATGLSVHDGFEALCQILRTADRLPTAEETRAIVQRAQATYRAKVESKGFLGILQGPMTDEIIAEQAVLISGLIWALRLKFLPWLHQSYRVCYVEFERIHLLSCTCGAGPLDAAQHIARGCCGIGLMLRNDLICQRRGAPTYAYFEVKTTGWDSDAWAEQWETKPQLGLGTIDAAALLGGEITELYIIVVNKGSRRRDQYESVPEGEPRRKKQQTALCYGYCRPGNPPLAVEDWLPAYQWIDEAGTLRRATRSHKRRGIWELADSDWSTWTAYHAQDPTMPPEEFWIRWLPTAILDKVCSLLGPMNRQDAQIASLRTSITADETRWQAVLWQLYEAQQGLPLPCDCAHGAGATQHLSACASHRHRPLAWESPEFQSLLDELIPCAWTCRPYGTEHQCSFVPICHRYVGWQDPLAGSFAPRRPHHAPERDQAVARGLLVEQAEEAIDEQERGE